MSFLRPEARAILWRLRETFLAGAVVALGLWCLWQGGLILGPLGVVVVILGTTIGRQSLARLRFAPGGADRAGGPGVVELDEAQLGYLGPEMGGFISLSEAVELRLITLRGRRLWRIRQADGQVLLIPVQAAGAERLFDAFASLPGMDANALSRAAQGAAASTGAATGATSGPALVPEVGEIHVVWRRAGEAGLMHH